MSYSTANPYPPWRLEAGVRRLPRGLRRQQLGDVGLGAAGLPGVEQLGRLVPHQVRGLESRVGPRDRELHALVRPDRPAEHHPLGRVLAGAVEEPAAVADDSAATRIRSAFIPSRMYRKPLPSSPMRFVGRTSRSSMKSSVVWWLIIV